MKRIFNFLPVLYFCSILTLIIGYTMLDWKLTTVLMYTIVFVFLAFNTLAWRITIVSFQRIVNGFLITIAHVIALLLTTFTCEIGLFWKACLVITLLTSTLFLSSALQRSVWKNSIGNYFRFIPIATTAIGLGIYFVTGNGIQFAIIGLIISALLAFVGTFLPQRA